MPRPDPPPTPLLDEGWAVHLEPVLPGLDQPQDWPTVFLREETTAWRSRLLEGSNPALMKRLQRIQESREIARALLGQAIRIGERLVDPELVWIEQELAVVDRTTGEMIEGGPGDHLALRCAVLHLMHADPANHWVGDVFGRKAVGDAEEERFEEPAALGGALRRHSSRLCSDHMAAQRSRSRARARRALQRGRAVIEGNRLERLARDKGWHWRLGWKFLTLTMWLVEGATSEREVKRILRAWRLFQKREEFGAKVRGGIRAVEDALTTDGPHVHLHVTLLARYWDETELRRVWAECLAKATREIYGVRIDLKEMEARGIRGGVIADLKRIVSRGRVRNEATEIELEDALEECIKYVTKPSDLSLLDAETLLDIELVERWGRMFEVFGVCREVRAAPTGEAGAFLDTTCISGGGETAKDGSLPFQPGDRVLMGLDPEPQRLTFKPVEAPPEDPPDPRPPSWRRLMFELGFHDWLQVMAARTRAARRFMGLMLRERFVGEFVTLEGRDLVMA